MNQAYVIRFKTGGYLGGGHAHGVALYRADLYETYKEAEEDRLERADCWDEMQRAETVRIIVSPNQ